MSANILLEKLECVKALGKVSLCDIKEMEVSTSSQRCPAHACSAHPSNSSAEGCSAGGMAQGRMVRNQV